MALLIFLSVAVAIFVGGNAYRVLRIARAPAHLRWELYPMPKGTREQQAYGGSYFERSEWWKHPATESRLSELLYIAREVFAFATLRRRNRPLWLWSWCMHMGLYLFAANVAWIVFATVTGSPWPRTVWWAAAVASCAGLTGVAGLMARRLSSPLRGLTSRSAWLNLVLIGALFGSALLALFSSTGETVLALAHAIQTTGAAPTAGPWCTVHLVITGIFLAYFPASHMTHAYMKFFMYHQVRWDDAAATHHPATSRAMAANVARPISWAAPHIATATRRTWAEAVAGPADQEVQP